MKSEWADYAAVQVECENLCENLSGNKLTRSLSGNTWPQSYQLDEPLWTDPGLKSGISKHELMSTLKTKGTGREWMVKHYPKVLTNKEKSTTTTTK